MAHLKHIVRETALFHKRPVEKSEDVTMHVPNDANDS